MDGCGLPIAFGDHSPMRSVTALAAAKETHASLSFAPLPGIHTALHILPPGRGAKVFARRGWGTNWGSS